MKYIYKGNINALRLAFLHFNIIPKGTSKWDHLNNKTFPNPKGVNFFEYNFLKFSIHSISWFERGKERERNPLSFLTKTWVKKNSVWKKREKASNGLKERSELIGNDVSHLDHSEPSIVITRLPKEGKPTDSERKNRRRESMVIGNVNGS